MKTPGIHKVLVIGGAGYIGSYLVQCLADDGYHVDACDLGKRGYPGGTVRHAIAYQDLHSHHLAEYDRVLWFAGHSSVQQSINDQDGALRNNCFDLYKFARSLSPQTRFIYASTASLYSGAIGTRENELRPCSESEIIVPNLNAYDISKFAFDYIAHGFLPNYIGLRMGTVSGNSPNLRPELIFNAMNIAALDTGTINISNPEAGRSILFLSDLYKAVRATIDLDSYASGFYNLSSLNTTIGEIAQRIANYHGAKLNYREDSPTYSFQMQTLKAEQEFNMKFNSDISWHCEEFCRTWRAAA